MGIEIIPLTAESKLYDKKDELAKLNVSLHKDFATLSRTCSPYLDCKDLEEELSFLSTHSDYIEEECRNLRQEFIHAKEEVKRIQAVPLAVGQFGEMIDEDRAIVNSNSGQTYLARVLSTIDREQLKPNTSLALHRHSSAVVKVLEPHVDAAVASAAMEKRPEVTFRDIGGLEAQKLEIREAVELPLTHGDLFRSVGIDPPQGVLLHGPPGTGKTMMAKAVANATNAFFISVVASEFVQKYLGEGARMVRNVFQMARENSENGAIIFIDEIDAIGMARHDSSISSDREVQRILLELLNQMDGFNQSNKVKVIMATNRPDTLDPALMRPGRLDRKIEFPLPDRRQKRLVFAVATAEMNLADEVDLEAFVKRTEKISAADIAAICAEAGLIAIRDNRYLVGMKDFEEAYQINVKRRDRKMEFYQ